MTDAPQLDPLSVPKTAQDMLDQVTQQMLKMFRIPPGETYEDMTKRFHSGGIVSGPARDLFAHRLRHNVSPMAIPVAPRKGADAKPVSISQIEYLPVLPSLEIIENSLLTETIEDWSDVRSPGRAARRRKQGHRQRIRSVTRPSRTLHRIGDKLYGHPETIKAMFERLGDRLHERTEDRLYGVLKGGAAR